MIRCTLMRHSMQAAFDPRSCPWREFVQVDNNSTAGSKQCFQFSLMTYNVLAEAYWKDDSSSSNPHHTLEAGTSPCRGENIAREIKHYKPDVLCMQEVDTYDSFYSEKLSNLGYEGLFLKRKGRKPDGCAVFYLTSKFTLMDFKEVDLDAVSHSQHPIIRADPGRFRKNCVALICHLKSTDNHSICVATSHIFWDPRFEDVKLMQTRAVLSAAEKFKKKVEPLAGCNVPLIIAGDFNSLPDSDVIQFVKEGCLQNATPRQKKAKFDFKHGLQLASAYDPLGNPNTNFTQNFTGCLDWIFYSTCSLAVVEVLNFDEENPLFSEYQRVLPNPWLSSDHIALMAKFAFV